MNLRACIPRKYSPVPVLQSKQGRYIALDSAKEALSSWGNAAASKMQGLSAHRPSDPVAEGVSRAHQHPVMAFDIEPLEGLEQLK